MTAYWTTENQVRHTMLAVAKTIGTNVTWTTVESRHLMPGAYLVEYGKPRDHQPFWLFDNDGKADGAHTIGLQYRRAPRGWDSV